LFQHHFLTIRKKLKLKQKEKGYIPGYMGDAFSPKLVVVMVVQ
jgi:hypothetical protein